MKYFLLCLTLLLLALGCQKEEAQYAVNCDFRPALFAVKKRVLVATTAAGEVLGTFEIPDIETASLNKQFSVKMENPPEQYDLHLVYVGIMNGPGNLYYVSIYSHFDVPNGALVDLLPYPVGPSTFMRFPTLRIHDVESYDSLDQVGHYRYHDHVLVPAEKRLDCSLVFANSQSLLLRLRANNEPQFRYCFIPDTLVSDTMSVSWQDLKPENNLKQLELPDGETREVRLQAVSPDFMHFTALFNQFNSLNGGIKSVEFNLPEEIQDPPAYIVYVDQINKTFEQIIQPGEPLRIEPPDMEIGNFSVSRESVSVETSGDIDLLRSECIATRQDEPIAAVSWGMEGRPESFKNHALPRLQEYLPDWYDQPEHQRVTALQFDQYDYPQVREGFPFKLSEPFALARSGYRVIWKEK